MQKEFIIEDDVLIKCLDVIEQTVHLESGGTKILMKCCFTVPEGVREIGDHAFEGIDSTIFVRLPKSLEKIGYAAFRNCSLLRDLVMHSGVKSIGREAFADGEPKVVHYYGTPEQRDQIRIGEGNSVFERWTKWDFEPELLCDDGTAHFEIENGSLCRYTGIAETVMIPQEVTKLKTIAFYLTPRLQKVVIPDSVTEIERFSFSECANLRDVVLPASLRMIEEGTFCDCLSLTQITIPEGVQRIDRDAFLYDVNLETVTLPKTLTEIGHDAFKECKKLRTVRYGGTEADLDKIRMYKGNEHLKKANWIFI